MSCPKRERARRTGIRSKNVMAVAREQAAEKELAKVCAKKKAAPNGNSEAAHKK